VAITRLKYEGIVSKCIGAPYRSDRVEAWQKIKVIQRGKFPLRSLDHRRDGYSFRSQPDLQESGFQRLPADGITLIPADESDSFADDTPTRCHGPPDMAGGGASQNVRPKGAIEETLGTNTTGTDNSSAQVRRLT